MDFRSVNYSNWHRHSPLFHRGVLPYVPSFWQSFSQHFFGAQRMVKPYNFRWCSKIGRTTFQAFHPAKHLGVETQPAKTKSTPVLNHKKLAFAEPMILNQIGYIIYQRWGIYWDYQQIPKSPFNYMIIYMIFPWYIHMHPPILYP